MKKILIAACISTIVASCDRVEMSEISSRLEINVKTASVTKAVVEGSALPSGTEIGLFVIGEYYEKQDCQNIKYTATGEGESQKWSTDTDIMLTAEQAAIYAYYPYQETNVIDALIEASSQIDWMYATPVENVNNKNSNVTLEMHHALAAVRINIASLTNNVTKKISKVKLRTRGITSKANLSLLDGNLSYIGGIGDPYIHEETLSLNDGPQTIDFITIPTGLEDIILIIMTIDGKDYLVETPDYVLIEAGKLYELNVVVSTNEIIQFDSINVKNWEVEINDEAEELETEDFIPWARIQHVDGTLYTADEWLAAETAGTVTDDKANGVAVRYSRFASCPHVIYPENLHFRDWMWYYSYRINNVFTTEKKGIALQDVNGQANTDAILADVTGKTNMSADAAKLCANIIFANGQQGYLPAAGELQAWYDNKAEIQKCLSAITDGTNLLGALSQNGSNAIWSSTQADALNAWSLDWKDGLVFTKKDKYRMVRPVTSFTYNP